MSLLLTFLCTTNHTKALTFDRAFDFQTKLVERNRIGLEGLDKIMKKDFTENNPAEDKDQTLESMVEKASGDFTFLAQDSSFWIK